MAGGASETAGVQLEVVTRTGVALQVTVDEVQAPSVDGEFGVLPGHLPLLAAMKSGVLSYRTGQETLRAVIGPGFGEVRDDKVTVLTEHFVPEDDIDPVATQTTLEAEKQALAALEEAGTTTGARVKERKSRIEWCEAQLSLVELWAPGRRGGKRGGESH